MKDRIINYSIYYCVQYFRSCIKIISCAQYELYVRGLFGAQSNIISNIISSCSIKHCSSPPSRIEPTVALGFLKYQVPGTVAHCFQPYIDDVVPNELSLSSKNNTSIISLCQGNSWFLVSKAFLIDLVGAVASRSIRYIIDFLCCLPQVYPVLNKHRSIANSKSPSPF